MCAPNCCIYYWKTIPLISKTIHQRKNYRKCFLSRGIVENSGWSLYRKNGNVYIEVQTKVSAHDRIIQKCALFSQFPTENRQHLSKDKPGKAVGTEGPWGNGWLAGCTIHHNPSDIWRWVRQGGWQACWLHWIHQKGWITMTRHSTIRKTMSKTQQSYCSITKTS